MQLNRNSINKYLSCIRKRIAESSAPEETLWDALEYDVYFEDLRRGDEENGLRRVDRSFALRGCPDSGEIRVRFFPVRTSKAVWDVVAERSPQGNDRAWRSYEVFGFRKTFRANWDDRLLRPYDPRDVLKLFWSVTEERIIASRGVPSAVFWLHLRESEFRFNHRRGDVYAAMLKMLKANPLEPIPRTENRVGAEGAERRPFGIIMDASHFLLLC